MKDKISLRKFRRTDLDAIMKKFVDKDVIRAIGLDKDLKDITRKFESEWLDKTIKNYRLKKPSVYNLAILLDGEHIGTIGCHKINYEDKNLEIGYWIGKDYWGQGYATKALKQYLKEIKKKFDPVRVVAYHFTFNPASGRVLEKCGFKKEGTKRKAKKIGKKYVDENIYALVK